MSRKTLLLALLAAVLTTCVCVAWLSRPEPVEITAAQARSAVPPIEPAEITAARAPVPPSAEVRAAEVLRAWDARRADAWARGDVRLLSTLYTASSVAGRRDRSMLRAWVARGLVVRALRTQLLAVREVRRTASTWTLRVTDRLAGGTAVGRGVSRRLPTDAATTRTVRLRMVDGSWRVASVSRVRAGPA